MMGRFFGNKNQQGGSEMQKSSSNNADPGFKNMTQGSAYFSTRGNANSNAPQQLHIDRLRVEIPNVHVFKLPPRQSGAGWRGADWREKVWQGTVKIVERREEGSEEESTKILLVDGTSSNIFAVCPVTGRKNAVERTVDSSRYFVLRIENASGKHLFIGIAFNERNDAFDFNTSLEDSRREKEAEKMSHQTASTKYSSNKDYSIKSGEKIHIALPKSGSLEEKDNSPDGGAAARRRARQQRNSSTRSSSKGGLLAPSSKDTPSRAPSTANESSSGSLLRQYF